VIVPPNSVITLSPAGSELKRVVGCPGTGDPAELGDGIANVVVGPVIPETPEVGSTVSALCPKAVCG